MSLTRAVYENALRYHRKDGPEVAVRELRVTMSTHDFECLSGEPYHKMNDKVIELITSAIDMRPFEAMHGNPWLIRYNVADRELTFGVQLATDVSKLREFNRKLLRARWRRVRAYPTVH